MRKILASIVLAAALSGCAPAQTEIITRPTVETLVLRQVRYNNGQEGSMVALYYHTVEGWPLLVVRRDGQYLYTLLYRAGTAWLLQKDKPDTALAPQELRSITAALEKSLTPARPKPQT